ncbi:MAG: DUF971 family protein [Pseudomonadales bacterium]|jgi:DUF971 family protein
MRNLKVPSKVKLHKRSKLLELCYGDTTYQLSCEYLRVFSPSAEVRGHGQGPSVLQFGKKDVAIISLTAVGNYAIQPTFDDGHDSGIYSWNYLFELAYNFDKNWQDYLTRLSDAGLARDINMQILKL